MAFHLVAGAFCRGGGLKSESQGAYNPQSGVSVLRSATRVAPAVPRAVGAACPVASPVVRRALRSVRVVLGALLPARWGAGA